MVTEQQPEVSAHANGFRLPESPRWRDGAVWFVDMFAGRVHRMTLDGEVTIVAEFDDHTSGLGFLSDGSVLTALKYKMVIMRIGPDGDTSVHADLGNLGAKHLNDMVVDTEGRAYVDTNSYLPGQPVAADIRDRIALVYPNGATTIVAENLLGPNGLAISRNNHLTVAEIRGKQISAFEIDQGTGTLGEKTLVVSTGPDRAPDGLCVDSEGAVWYASPRTGEVLRILPSGSTSDTVRVDPGKFALACCLGGDDRRTLFITTAVTTSERIGRYETDDGLIESVRVRVPGEGTP
jgi:sugar lactone lactonase YvrE